MEIADTIKSKIEEIEREGYSVYFSLNKIEGIIIKIYKKPWWGVMFTFPYPLKLSPGNFYQLVNLSIPTDNLNDVLVICPSFEEDEFPWTRFHTEYKIKKELNNGFLIEFFNHVPINSEFEILLKRLPASYTEILPLKERGRGDLHFQRASAIWFKIFHGKYVNYNLFNAYIYFIHEDNQETLISKISKIEKILTSGEHEEKSDIPLEFVWYEQP